MSGKFSYTRLLQLAGVSCSVLVLLAAFRGEGPEWPAALVLMAAGLAVAASFSRGVLGQLAFTSWILVGVCVGMAFSPALIRFPDEFGRFGGQETSIVFIPVLQLIMFAMGTTLSVADFTRVLRMPTGVVIGLACQFTLMPLIGYVLAYSFGLPAEIAAGLILVGSSPGGLASNVMVFIARANVALSVTMTACSTLAAPIVTPLLMRLLGGELVEIDVSAMMWSMTKIVLLPVLAGLVFHHVLFQRMRWLGSVMPIVSMAGILIMTVLTVAVGRDRLIEVGGLLIVACVLHSTAGFVLGYAACRLLRRDVQTCRTIALEVGLQNSGMAAGLAKELGKVATLGLVPIVFGPVMNVIASVLANWWRANPAERDVLSD
jgi:BASS family bile acid:Na+ symporter